MFCGLFEWCLLHTERQATTFPFGFAYVPRLVVSIIHSLSAFGIRAGLDPLRVSGTCRYLSIMIIEISCHRRVRMRLV